MDTIRPKLGAPGASALIGLMCLVGAHGAEPAPTVLPEFRVAASVQTDTSLGTSTYTLNRGQVETIAQGADSSFNQVLFRTPSVSQQADGLVHFRLEDPYFQYYINGVLLPRAINGFAQEIDPRFVDSIALKVGALPAQYAWGNYGIVALQSKTGASLAGSQLSIYGGSQDTAHVTASIGGSHGATDAFVTASASYNAMGIQNPTPEREAIHDRTRQYQGFGYLAHKLSDISKLSFIFSASHNDYQIPNNPDQTSEIEFQRRGETWRAANYPVVDSSTLDENQREQSYYGIASYQLTRPDLSLQIAGVTRYTGVLFTPDVDGDLYFKGVAARVFRDILTVGLQADFTSKAGERNTVRGGLLLDTAAARDHNTVSVFNAEDDDVDPVNGRLIAKNSPRPIVDNHHQRGYDGTFYLQDAWKATDRMTVNFGGRFDGVNAYVNENQFSPRISAVYQVASDTALHAGFARYFVPPPLENVSPSSVAMFVDTTNASDQTTDDPVRCERSSYYDVGFTHRFSPELEIGIDAYHKQARNQIDDGQFGAANIFSPYNYDTATIYGAELALNYTHGPLSAYGNFAAANSRAKGIVSSQFEFDADAFNYIQTHNVTLDPTQYYTASGGVSYSWAHTTIHGDILYGNGTRRGERNEDKLPAYYPVNLGLEHRVPLGRRGVATLRLDVTNVFDQITPFSDGTGIGIGAPRYGPRRGIFGGVTFTY